MAGFAFNSLPSPDKHRSKPTSFLFGLTAFASKAFNDTDPSVMSPTSILDAKPFSALRNPFWSDPTSTPKSNTTPPEPKSSDSTKRLPWDKFDSGKVGLGIVDHLAEDEKSNDDDPKSPSSSSSSSSSTATTKPENSKLVVFGSQLKIQIPPITAFPADSPKSPMEFGIKTKNHLLLSPTSPFASKHPHGSGSPAGVFTGCLSPSEMEQSEEYTCVISRGGPVTKMTRIFDNCVVESRFSSDGIAANPPSRKVEENGFCRHVGSMNHPSSEQSFLSFCYTCKKNLGHGRDIYIYRGEKAFCSDDCRQQEMMLEETLTQIGGEGSW